jgi:hypothetical protein
LECVFTLEYTPGGVCPQWSLMGWGVCVVVTIFVTIKIIFHRMVPTVITI